MTSVDMTPSCQHGAVAANEVVWIGDGWLTTGLQVTTVRDQARAIGAIGQNDDYVNLAANGATISTIASQYSAAASATAKPKVLIMDGGTVDTIQAGASDATVRNVTSAFSQLLARIAADGTVSHIIYIMVPELPAITGVTALRPPLQQACAQSAVPCHFIDLQPIWAEGGGHPEYTASNGILPSTSGARAMAAAIWSTMQSSCIAQ